jgi:hypothetical protein
MVVIENYTTRISCGAERRKSYRVVKDGKWPHRESRISLHATITIQRYAQCSECEDGRILTASGFITEHKTAAAAEPMANTYLFILIVE